MATSSNNGKLKITTQLDSTNYSLWYFQMQILLEQEGCILYNDNDEYRWFIKDRLHEIRENSRSRMCIVSNCSESILTSLMGMTTGTEMWKYLYNTYSGENYSRKLQGIKAGHS